MQFARHRGARQLVFVRCWREDFKDYEFSRATMREHWFAGVRDMSNTLAHPEWLQSASADGVTTYDLVEPSKLRVRRPRPKPQAMQVAK